MAQDQVDIMLMSACTNEMLVIHERLFDHSPVTPAARTNDTTDIWLATGRGPLQLATVGPFPHRDARPRPVRQAEFQPPNAAWAPTWAVLRHLQ